MTFPRVSDGFFTMWCKFGSVNPLTPFGDFQPGNRPN